MARLYDRSQKRRHRIKDGIQKVWDVSAQGDDSILAWTSDENAPYTVYIGSAWEMFANQDSSNLFWTLGRISGYAEPFENIELLNTETNSITLLNFVIY